MEFRSGLCEGFVKDLHCGEVLEGPFGEAAREGKGSSLEKQSLLRKESWIKKRNKRKTYIYMFRFIHAVRQE